MTRRPRRDPETGWLKGGTPESSRIVPWSVETLQQEDVQHWQRSLEQEIVNTAVEGLVGYVEPGDE